VSDERIQLEGSPINLLKGTQLETPVAPNGDANDYDISPDGMQFIIHIDKKSSHLKLSKGKEIAFTARVPVRSQAWNTNTDIYLVPTDGSEPPQPISAYNLGYDMHPKYSLDGSWLAWLQMPTPQYEADRNRIALYSRGNLTVMKTSLLSDEWDRSPESITWTEEGLIITAQELGRLKLFTVDTSGWVKPVVEDGNSNQVQYVPGLGVVFVKSSLTSLPEIFSYNEDTGEVEQWTSLTDALSDVALVDPEVYLSILLGHEYR
jgi:dipeptidyl aminopeptidase/acylaminoacyl peptidase